MKGIHETLAAAMSKAGGVPREYRRPHPQPPALPCRHDCGRTAPDQHIEGMGWMSLHLCDPCQEAAERQEGRMMAQLREEQRRERVMEGWIGAGLTATDMGCPHKLRPEMEGMVKAAHNQDHSWCRYLWGGTGTGKTTQAALLVRERVQAGWRCLFVTEAVLLASLRPGGGRELADYIGLDLLVIDEVGRDGLTDWSAGQLSELLDLRLGERHRRPTALTSNLSPAQLGTGPLGRRVFERLAVACGQTGIIECRTNYRARLIGLGAA